MRDRVVYSDGNNTVTMSSLYKCLKCRDSGYIAFEKAVPEVYGDDHKVPFAKPCDCEKGRTIAMKLDNSGFWKKKAQEGAYIG